MDQSMEAIIQAVTTQVLAALEQENKLPDRRSEGKTRCLVLGDFRSYTAGSEAGRGPAGPGGLPDTPDDHKLCPRSDHTARLCRSGRYRPGPGRNSRRPRRLLRAFAGDGGAAAGVRPAPPRLCRPGAAPPSISSWSATSTRCWSSASSCLAAAMRCRPSGRPPGAQGPRRAAGSPGCAPHHRGAGPGLAKDAQELDIPARTLITPAAMDIFQASHTTLIRR